MGRNKTRLGFTIVELLIVIVVIAILAAITIVAYNGIQQRSTNSAVQSETAQFVKKIEAYKIANSAELYPTTQSAAGISSSSSDVRYVYDTGTNSYCVQSKRNIISYFATSINPSVRPGLCINAPETMIGWWKMNNSITDDSVSASVGSATNITVAVGQNGQANQAYAFDGSTSFLQIPSNSTLSTSMQTVSLWVNTSPATGTRVFAATRGGASSGWLLANVNSAITLDCGTSSNRYSSNTSLTANTWMLLTGVCAQDGTVALYINGVAAGAGTTVNRASMASSTNLVIGRDSYTPQYYTAGSFDDVRVYKRALTAAEVQDLYTQGAL